MGYQPDIHLDDSSMKISLSDLKESATSHRKNGNYTEAITLYEKLWFQSQDAYDGTGLLNCYRKTEVFDKAIPLARELFLQHMNIEWTAREVCWTIVQAKIQTFDESSSLDEISRAAETILKYSPDFLAKKIAVFAVLKWAKKKDNWKTIGNWIDKVKVDDLSLEPINLYENKKGWSDKCLWYNYKINYLLTQSEFENAKSLSLHASTLCPKQQFFFLRLQAQALRGMGLMEDATAVYAKLCDKPKVDWWLLHEYGNILKENGNTIKSLKILCKAALANKKRNLMVTLFSDIGDLCLKDNDLSMARYHYYLEKFVREDNNWFLPDTLKTIISSLDDNLGTATSPTSQQKAFASCKVFWQASSDYSNKCNNTHNMSNLIGEIVIPKDKPFCFVNTREGLSAICFPKDISDDIIHGDAVIFDITPSFDRKKDRDSWKAINIKKSSSLNK